MIRVLIVEDHQVVAEGLGALLDDQEDMTVVGKVGSVGESIGLAAELSPDVVILDIGMPVLTGYDVARALRKSSASADVLLIAVTSYNTQTDKFLSKLAGFDYHLAKPVDPNSLSATIRDYLAGNRPVRIRVIPEHDIPR